MFNIKEVFHSFDKINVLVLGDVMIDRYLTGKVDRISPEAPVPVVQLDHTENRLGGAANVALNLKAMGAKPYLCSIIGNDENTDTFMELLAEESLVNTGILQSKTRCTTVKTRVIAANQHLLRVDRENTQDLSYSESSGLFEQVLHILNTKKIHVILFQDYNKGVLHFDLIQKVLLEAHRRDIPTAIDPKKNNFLSYRRCTLFKPNLKEIKEAIPLFVDAKIENLEKASRYLQSKLGHQYTLITLSDKGVFLSDGTNSQILATQPRKIADVCGAGDTVASIAALGIAVGLTLPEIALLSNLAGGQVCEKVGVVPVDKFQLQSEFSKFILQD